MQVITSNPAQCSRVLLTVPLFLFKFAKKYFLTQSEILEKVNKMSSNTLMETLKITFIEIGDNYVVCKMPVTSDVHQPAGILHGGATAALVETVGSFASRYFIKNKDLVISRYSEKFYRLWLFYLTSCEFAFRWTDQCNFQILLDKDINIGNRTRDYIYS